MGSSKQYWAGRVCFVCVFPMTGAPEGSTESGFMGKLGIKPVTPGLQGIGLSPTPKKTFCGFPEYKPVLPSWFKICVLVL